MAYHAAHREKELPFETRSACISGVAGDHWAATLGTGVDRVMTWYSRPGEGSAALQVLCPRLQRHAVHMSTKNPRCSTANDACTPAQPTPAVAADQRATASCPVARLVMAQLPSPLRRPRITWQSRPPCWPRTPACTWATSSELHAGAAHFLIAWIGSGPAWHTV